MSICHRCNLVISSKDFFAFVGPESGPDRHPVHLTTDQCYDALRADYLVRTNRVGLMADQEAAAARARDAAANDAAAVRKAEEQEKRFKAETAKAPQPASQPAPKPVPPVAHIAAAHSGSLASKK